VKTQDIGYVTNPGATHALAVLSEDEHISLNAAACLLALGIRVDHDLGTADGYSTVQVSDLIPLSGAALHLALLELVDRGNITGDTETGWRIPDDVRVPDTD
jgi:hypothetical protein